MKKKWGEELAGVGEYEKMKLFETKMEEIHVLDSRVITAAMIRGTKPIKHTLFLLIITGILLLVSHQYISKIMNFLFLLPSRLCGWRFC